MRYKRSLAMSLSVLVFAGQVAHLRAEQSSSASRPARAGEQAFRALYKELVEINTTFSVGSCTVAANAMKAHLVKAGYPENDLHLIVPPDQPRFGNLIALLPGTDANLKPLMLLAAVTRLKKNPTLNGILHTTCIPTMIDGGHAFNALPQHVTANVNCRIFPGHEAEEIRQTLIKTIGDAGVKVTFQAEPEKGSLPPPLTPDIMGPIEKLTSELFPGVPWCPRNHPAGQTGASSHRQACRLMESVEISATARRIMRTDLTNGYEFSP